MSARSVEVRQSDPQSAWIQVSPCGVRNRPHSYVRECLLTICGGDGKVQAKLALRVLVPEKRIRREAKATAKDRASPWIEKTASRELQLELSQFPEDPRALHSGRAVHPLLEEPTLP
jgi:hypothetical protein